MGAVNPSYYRSIAINLVITVDYFKVLIILTIREFIIRGGRPTNNINRDITTKVIYIESRLIIILESTINLLRFLNKVIL